jgi:hypothetical protein
MSSWHAYPSIFNVGHRAVQDLTNGNVLVEEKIDGSQFSFGICEDEEGASRLRVRSKGAEFPVDAPPKMFEKACETVKRLEPRLHPGWTYRAEYLAKPTHNTLPYHRVPKDHLILFDVNTEQEGYLGHTEKSVEAQRLGLEVVPLLFFGHVATPAELRAFLETDSILGGVKIEGMVIKPLHYDVFGQDKKCLMAKFVSEKFKEAHRRVWKVETRVDRIQRVIDAYGTSARWDKAIQHLRDAGALEGAPQDIGKLMAEVPGDIFAECEGEIKDALWELFKKDLTRGWVRGLPEYYKQRLLEAQFE